MAIVRHHVTPSSLVASHASFPHLEVLMLSGLLADAQLLAQPVESVGREHRNASEIPLCVDDLVRRGRLEPMVDETCVQLLHVKASTVVCDHDVGLVEQRS